MVASSILATWLVVNYIAFSATDLNWYSWQTLLFTLILTHLYTGIFITAHDAMHGIVNTNSHLNNIIGYICAGLIAFNYFPFLLKNHHKHHNYVGTNEDPDYHNGNFFIWYFQFSKHYIKLYQIVLMAITFNVLAIWVDQWQLTMFWTLPLILSTLQLFYFGTYQPHRVQHHHKNIHKSGSLSKQHFVAFMTCYFFGYHFEHHDKPFVPWWQLYKHKV